MCNPRSTGHFSLDALASALARSPQKRREDFSAMSDLVQFRPNPKPSQLINATARLRNANMMFIISRHRRTSCCAHFSQSSASMMGPRGRPGLWMEAPRLRAVGRYSENGEGGGEARADRRDCWESRKKRRGGTMKMNIWKICTTARGCEHLREWPPKP